MSASVRAALFLVVFSSPAFSQELTRDELFGLEFSSLSEKSPAELRAARMPYREGLIVTDNESAFGVVLPGIQRGDILVRVDKHKLKDVAAFDEWLATKKLGETAEFTLHRRNRIGRFETEKVTVTLPKSRYGLPMSDADRDLLAETEARIAETNRKMAAIEADLPRLAAAAKEGKAKWETWESGQAKLDPSKRPYELKGDRLGMTLDMFKGKHFRTIKGDPRPAPFCSDSSPDQDNVSLLYQAALGKAGIVHARTTFPFEEHGADGNFPTIAGVPAQTMVFHFVDGKLYQITVSINHSGYEKVKEAMLSKYESPTSTATKTYQNRFGAKFTGDILSWDNEVSSILMMEYVSQLDRSMLLFQHKELAKLAEQRKGEAIKPNTDDL